MATQALPDKENIPQRAEKDHKTTADKPLPQNALDDAENLSDEYDEDQDEDYVVVADTDATGKQHTARDATDDDDASDEEFIDDEDKSEMAKYSSIESAEGGLVKTRRQRQEEEEQLLKEKKNHVHTTASASKVDINSIWAELNSPASAKSPSSSSLSPPTTTPSPQPKSEPQTTASGDNKIKITRTYEFAGNITTETKWVDADSEEAKAHLNSTAIKQSDTPFSSPTTTSTPQQKNLRRKRKRASLLDAVISNSSKTKLSTLEKSRLDWATYVDKNKISDELKYTNKGGYLEKQDFLNRVDSRRDDLYSEAKSKMSKQN